MSQSVSNSSVSNPSGLAATASDDVFVFPTSFAQQRLWLLEEIEKTGGAYNMPISMLLTGPLNIDALEQAIAEIVNRHEALRTNFQMVDDNLVQVIAETATFKLQTEKADIASDSLPLSPTSLSPTLRQLIASETRRPFDLKKDSLLRVKLLQLSDEQNILTVTMHHIISDAWSLGIFRQELTELYAAFSANKPPSLEPLAIQYADFALWQKDFLAGDTLQSHIDYWQEKLAGAPPLLELPTDRPRPPVQTFKGGAVKFQLTPELSQSLKTISQQSQSTVFMTLLAAFNVLLSRYSGLDDIVVGSPIANRQRKELESIIGCFVNTLVFRTQLQNNPTFTELLAQTRQNALEAYTHQDLPFEKLVEALQPERSLSHSPLFQVLFVLQNAPKGRQRLEGLKIQRLPRSAQVSKFDLSVAMAETVPDTRGMDESVGSYFSGTFEYNTDLFDEATIKRMLGHFKQLLEVIAQNPDRPISALSMLETAERNQLVTEWNHTITEAYSAEQCVHRLFEAQAVKTPDAIALTFATENAASGMADTHMTYQQLNERADKLAGYLRSRNFPSGTLIGICLERSFDMVVALLGTLKAGLAYVPLDPSYPTARLAFMLEDANVSQVLTQQSLLARIAEFALPTLCLDTDLDTEQEKLEQSSSAPEKSVSPDAIAYVMYTSGSTGKPKGVQICHRSVSNLVQSMTHRPGVSSEDSLLSITTLSFDIAVFEIFSPLIVGARVILVSSDVATDGTRLRPVLERSDATIMQATPATWQLLLTAGWRGQPKPKIICGGEALSAELAAKLGQCGTSLWNGYGPTEGTVYTTFAEIQAEGTLHQAPITIGTPVNNVKTYVLDRHFNPLPIGVPGELHIGGIGLSLGYLNRLDLTAEKFIESPFVEGDRLYKTGDLVKYEADGKIAYLGRLDNQVKLRGFRIELGEIEATLGQHSKLHQSVVLMREDRPGDKRLVGYAVATDGEQAPTQQQLQQFVQEKLPHYMVPSTIVMLESMPLMPNGKINRKVLPAPDWGQVPAEVNNVLPSTPTEKKVAEIWLNVLGIEAVGIHDNFFALGGHSLLAAQVISRLRSHFAVDISLRTLFESTTVSQLAQVIEKKQTKGEQSTAAMSIPRSSRRRRK
ncbi:MAG: amino acid adenylation domain-containing protein [Cyanobacteria bacterium J06632_3]